VRCAIEVQNGMVERNAGVPEDRRIEFRIGVHLGDVVEEADGDLIARYPSIRTMSTRSLDRRARTLSRATSSL
jgi:hypothetical protein